MQTSPLQRRMVTVGLAGIILASLAVPPADAGHGYRMTQDSSEAYLDRLRADATISDMSEITEADNNRDRVMRHPLRGDFPGVEADSAPAAPNGSHVRRVRDIRHPLRGDFPYASGASSRTE